MWVGPLERKVMEIFWGDLDQQLTVREVADQMDEYAYTTIATVLDRLREKDLLNQASEGRILKYSASGTRAAHTALLMREVLMATKDPDAALSSLAVLLPQDQRDALRHSLETL
jgi:predicted transcriptional regulator